MVDKDKRILIVDDDETIRELLMVWLGNRGFLVETARDARVAKEQLRQAIPNLILLDVMMPGMNGFDLFRWINDQPKLKDVPIISMSALDDKVTIQDAMEMGSQDFIQKPFERDILIQKVEAGLARMERRKRGESAA